MTYTIKGLDPAPFAPLFELDDRQLKAQGMTRMLVNERPSFPCRISLDDAGIGETVLLLNHVSHDGNNPYRTSHAIFVSSASQAAEYVDAIPPALDRRILSLRSFDASGLMIDAALVQPGDADPAIRNLFANPAADHIDAHNAIRGCFAARIDRN